MKKYAITRRNNTDKKIAQEMLETLKQCVEKGWRAPINQSSRMTNIRHTLYMREMNQQNIPEELLKLRKALLSYPTQYQHDRKKQLDEAKKNQAEQEKKQQQFKKIFPNAELLMVVMGNDVYGRVMNASADKHTAKILSEYVGYVVDSVMCKNARNYDILLMFCGVDQEPETQDNACKHIYKSKTLNIPENGVRPHIIAKKYGICQMRIEQVLRHSIRNLREHFNPEIFEHYISGNTKAMMDLMPEKMIKMMDFRQKNNITTPKTTENNQAGRILLMYFRKHFLENQK